jgi:hypothetical protein
MKRLFVLAAAAAAAILVVSASAGDKPGHGHGHGKGPKAGKTLTVVERATTDAVTNPGTGAGGVGDILTFANDVYDKSNATKVGSDQGSCVRVVVGKWECMWTTILAKGQITVEGPFLDTGNSTLAITGGTGAYRNARGEMVLEYRNPAGTEFNFVFHLIG